MAASAIHQHTVCLLISSLRPADPIQFATFRLRRSATSRVVIEKNKRSAFFLRNLLRLRSVSPRSRPDRACRVLSRVDRRGLWGRRSTEEPEYRHFLPLWLSRRPSFLLVVHHCQVLAASTSRYPTVDTRFQDIAVCRPVVHAVCS